ncbi:MAG: sirohydrochlorin cobaltochelatase [Synergistaceae bacterium]|nr:sirohydrochlorin cobaltochelatase [Synergistaceae bacterium]
MNKFLCALVLVTLLIPASAFAADSDSSKTAILVVSFGTSMPEARKAIDNLVNAAKDNFPDSEVRLSFTSNIIRRKLAESGDIIDTPVIALAKLNDERFTDVYVMPTHMIPGVEYDELKNVVEAFRTLRGKYGFRKLKLGVPFLNSPHDCSGMADVLMMRFKTQLEDKETGIILMGHGTPNHFANGLYPQLQLALNQRAHGRFFVGTVESSPLINDVLAELKLHPEIKKLVLSPLMIVAGDHANNDLADPLDSKSWLSILKNKGYQEITTYLVGLGEDENLKREFVRQILELMD